MKTSQVAIVRCDSYDPDSVFSSVSKGISLLGGIDRFCSSDEQILLKPNILLGTDPQKCVITHPNVFKAVAQILQKHGVTVQYGDSPAALQSSLQAMQKSGFFEVASVLNIKLSDFDKGRIVPFPEGLFYKQLHIVNAVFSSDGLISLPKLKTHGLTRMTGAIKNQYGCVPGFIKGDYHAKLPDVYNFSKLLVEINRFIKPRLFIMDAICAMEGNGPQNGDPKKLGLLLFSTDPVALDSVASRIIDLNPDFVPPIVEGVKAGLGVSSPDQIEIIGEKIESVIDTSFKVVKSAPAAIPQNNLLKQIRSFFTERPVIDKKKCIKCLRCINSCPVRPRAIECKNKKKAPKYDYKACIRCFCCHEVCPANAISIKDPLIRKLLPIVSYISLFITNKHSKTQSKKV